MMPVRWQDPRLTKRALRIGSSGKHNGTAMLSRYIGYLAEIGEMKTRQEEYSIELVSLEPLVGILGNV